MFKGRSDARSAPDLDGVLGVMRSSDEGKTLQPMAPIADVRDWRVPQLSMAALAVDRSGGPFQGGCAYGPMRARSTSTDSSRLIRRGPHVSARASSDDGPALRMGDGPFTSCPWLR
jgi:hypothetical protein